VSEIERMRSFTLFSCLVALLFCIAVPCMAFSVTVEQKPFVAAKPAAATAPTTAPTAPTTTRALSSPINTVLAATHKAPITTQAAPILLGLTVSPGYFSPSFSSTTYSYS
jgi:hypothetical protein